MSDQHPVESNKDVSETSNAVAKSREEETLKITITNENSEPEDFHETQEYPDYGRYERSAAPSPPSDKER